MKSDKNIFDVLFSRSSYRGKYKDSPVPREDLELIIKAGIAAPSGCNRQTPVFVAIDDKDKISAIRKAFPRPSTQTAPAFIMVFTQKIVGIDGYYYNVEDYAAAIENMLLTIKALGYESCWYQGGVRACADEFRALVKLPEQYSFVCLLPVGIAEDEVSMLLDKKIFSERAWFNEYKI